MPTPYDLKTETDGLNHELAGHRIQLAIHEELHRIANALEHFWAESLNVEAHVIERR